MKSVIIQLTENDKKAKDFILDSLSICAHNHVLSRKLSDRFSKARGPMFAIIGDWYDLDQLPTYEQGTPSPPASPAYVDGDRPRDRLVAFVQEYLRSTTRGIVICENWAADRGDIEKWQWPPPRVACYGDNEVYHLVTPAITDPE